MAAIVYHGLQSHLEPQIVESRTIRLRLPSPKPVPSQSIDLAFKSCFRDSNSNIKTNQEQNISKTETKQQNKPVTSNTNRSWNFLDALSNISQETKQEEASQKETTYVHPQQKRSSLVLSPKSLQICTENLGNESGTDIVENSIDDMFSSSSSLGTREQNQRQGCQVFATKKAKTQTFPPPLTTIRGSESLRVRPHREDGRLVIEVTKVPPSASCFQAERSHGRLRLCFFTNQSTSFDPQEEQEDEEEYDNIDENEPTNNEGFDEEYYNHEMNAQILNDEEEEQENKQEKEETDEEAEEEEEVVEYDDVRMDKYGRPRRCNEGGDHRENNELLNWGERLWVANC